nr:hypothetical protein [Candidatus Njordarchaeota archaeon]
MIMVYAPDEEKRKRRKEKLRVMRATEEWRRKRALYGAGKVFKRNIRWMRGG